MQGPPVAEIGIEPAGGAFVAQGDDLGQECLQFEQGVMAGPGVAGHRGAAVTRSGLTCSFAQCAVGVDGDLGAQKVGCGALELERVEQVPVIGDVPAEAAGGGVGEAGAAVPGGQGDQAGGVRADLLLGAGRQVRRLGEWLAHR